MPQLIIAIIVIVLVGYAIAFTLLAVLFIGINVLAVIDKIWGSWAFVPPSISWALISFLIGSSVHFAVREAGKLSRPAVIPAILTSIFCFFVITPFVGPLTKFSIREAVPMINISGDWVGQVDGRKAVLIIEKHNSQNINGEIKYAGVTERLEGKITKKEVLLKGINYYRTDSQSTTFSLDTFVGQISEKRMDGTYYDKNGKNGKWFVIKNETQKNNAGFKKKSVLFLPNMPYEDHGACPFECCTYREWSVEEDTKIYETMDEDSNVLFVSAKGETVLGETGIVITTKLGKGKMLKKVLQDNNSIDENIIISVLSYSGEGFYKVWHNDKLFSLQEGNDFEMTEQPDAIWWVKIKNSEGKFGWTKKTSNFGNMDACG